MYLRSEIKYLQITYGHPRRFRPRQLVDVNSQKDAAGERVHAVPGCDAVPGWGCRPGLGLSLHRQLVFSAPGSWTDEVGGCPRIG
jgi:hypothetical protein